MRATIENSSDHISSGARSVEKVERTKEGYNHFREWQDNRRTKPYVLAYKRVKGDKITTIKWDSNGTSPKTAVRPKGEGPHPNQHTRPMSSLLRHTRKLGKRDRKLLTQMARLMAKRDSRE